MSWEISIKFSIGRMPLPEPPGTFVPSRVRRLVATLLPIEHEHTFGVPDLPMHHRDPFDRLLIAQSRSLGVPILTADRIFTQYDAEVLLIE